MESRLNELSEYRLEKAKKDLERAKQVFDFQDYTLTTNRSYYAIFHAMRAVNALDGFDSKKHSGVIAHFNYEHVKNGDFPKEITKMIKAAMEIRHNSDYEDFYIVSKDTAEKQLENAEYIVSLVDAYLNK